MNRRETIEVITVLKVAYPSYYSRFNREELGAVVNLWERMFSNDDYQIVMLALEALIARHSGYPPDIAALRKQIRDMSVASFGEPTDEELWHMLQQAAANGCYNYRQEFEKLPPILRRYLGVPEQLREFAMMDENTFNTVAKGQFLKQIGNIRERQEFEDHTPDAVKQLFAASYKKIPSQERLTGAEVNERRNQILNQLEERTQKQ